MNAAVFGRVPYERAVVARRPSSPSSHSPLPSIRLPRRAGTPKPLRLPVVAQFDGYYQEGSEVARRKYLQMLRQKLSGADDTAIC